MLKCAFVGVEQNIRKVFGADRLAALAERTQLYGTIVSRDGIEAHLDALGDVEVILSTWGMPELTEAQLAALPQLRLVLYAAGDVRGFASPLITRGVSVVSAWRANAIPVAEFTLAHILLAGKSYLPNIAEYRVARNSASCRRGPGNCGETVAILGVGAIGRALIELLRPFQWNVVAYDRFLTTDQAIELGVSMVSLEEAFALGHVVTNHLADNESTTGLIDVSLLESMGEGATFINTGRGRTVESDGFLDVLTRRPDLTAVLDVTDPEPVPPDSALWNLPNVFMSTHIAGSMGNELGRMAALCLEELDRYMAGKSLLHLVSASALER